MKSIESLKLVNIKSVSHFVNHLFDDKIETIFKLF